MKDLIFNQRQIPKEQWRYGLRSSAAAGCGWIATYNALRLLGYRTTPEDLIRYYERQFPLINGNFGTCFWGPALYFRHWGFPVELSARVDRFDEIAQRSDVCILFYHWHQGARFGAHFVAVEKTEAGFVGYNTYRSSTGPDPFGGSLSQFLKRKHYYGAVLTGIRKKE